MWGIQSNGHAIWREFVKNGPSVSRSAVRARTPVNAFIESVQKPGIASAAMSAFPDSQRGRAQG
jgi:hypothetical protein